MSGTLATYPLAAGKDSPNVYACPAGTVARLITAGSSSAKLQVSYDGGASWRDGAFGTLGASTTKSELFARNALVRATCLTGTATLEIDAAVAAEPHSRVLAGAGSPAGAVIAPVGTIYLRTDGGAATTLYLKTTGSDANGWTAVTSA